MGDVFGKPADLVDGLPACPRCRIASDRTMHKRRVAFCGGPVVYEWWRCSCGVEYVIQADVKARQFVYLLAEDAPD